MELAAIGLGGQITVPKRVREAANLRVGDTLAFEVRGDHLVVRKVVATQDAYLRGLAQTLGEWHSRQDQEAWREL